MGSRVLLSVVRERVSVSELEGTVEDDQAVADDPSAWERGYVPKFQTRVVNGMLLPVADVRFRRREYDGLAGMFAQDRLCRGVEVYKVTILGKTITIVPPYQYGREQRGWSWYAEIEERAVQKASAA